MAATTVNRNPLRLLTFSRESALAVLIILMIIACSLLFPRTFFSTANFSAILRNLALDGIMVIGMTLLLVAGVFDLSIGSIFSMVGVLTGWMMTSAGFPVPIAIVGGLVIGAVAGLINGLLVGRFKVNALITTLGTMGIFRGVAILVGGPGISNLPVPFSSIGQSKFLGLQFGVWLMIAVAIIFYVLMSRTRFFRKYYYIGGNERASFLSGINVPRMQIWAFMISGLLAGLSGMVFASRVGTAVSIAGDGAELRIITAAVLGGASLTGGKGTVIGGIIGVIFIALINNILIIAQVDSYWQSIVIGTVLVLAVGSDSLLNRA